ncbi:MAG: asparagine synthase (glutamine-hydrolyzing) [Candidatus Hodarchaeota archaeon]
MCGITGIYGQEDLNLIRKMTDSLIHRGPDDVDYYHDSQITLGHRRLSIIDLLKGRQPIYNEDRSIIIVYNGEIYNFKSIRKFLEEKGHTFYTDTDTEVIVHAYEEFGIDSFSQFNGMFAFALWDTNTRKLILVRDRHGIKPLYYYKDPNSLNVFFASEIKAILQNEEIPRVLNKEALHQFLNLRYCPGPKTLLKNIMRVPPGVFLEITADGIKEKTFAKLDLSMFNQPISEEKAINDLRQILYSSVQRHMISDVPIGIYLSGGIDSSSLVALVNQNSDKTLSTFCMGFGEDNDELEDAQLVADYFGTSHKSFIVKSNLNKDLPKLIWYADFPKRNLYTYYVSEVVSQYVKVVLSGLGADELFGGYIWKYKFLEENKKFLKKIQKSNRSLQDLKAAAQLLFANQIMSGPLLQDRHCRYLKQILTLDSTLDQYLLIKSLDEVLLKDQLTDRYGPQLNGFDEESIRNVYTRFFDNQLAPTDQCLLADFSIKAVDDFLFVEDAMSMANSLECRVPYLDNELVEFAFKLQNSLKFQNGEGKYILRKAMRPLLPKAVFKKKKQGFGPLSAEAFFNKEVRGLAEQLLPNGSLVRNNFLKSNYINRVLSCSSSPDLAEHYNFLQNCVTAEIWYRMYIEPEEFVKPSFEISAFL